MSWNNRHGRDVCRQASSSLVIKGEAFSMRNIIYIIGLIVVVLAILSFVGLA